MVDKEFKVYISLSIGLCFDFSYKRGILCNEISYEISAKFRKLQ